MVLAESQLCSRSIPSFCSRSINTLSSGYKKTLKASTSWWTTQLWAKRTTRGAAVPKEELRVPSMLGLPVYPALKTWIEQQGHRMLLHRGKIQFPSVGASVPIRGKISLHQQKGKISLHQQKGRTRKNRLLHPLWDPTGRAEENSDKLLGTGNSSEELWEMPWAFWCLWLLLFPCSTSLCCCSLLHTPSRQMGYGSC